MLDTFSTLSAQFLHSFLCYLTSGAIFHSAKNLFPPHHNISVRKAFLAWCCKLGVPEVPLTFPLPLIVSVTVCSEMFPFPLTLTLMSVAPGSEQLNRAPVCNLWCSWKRFVSSSSPRKQSQQNTFLKPWRNLLRRERKKTEKDSGKIREKEIYFLKDESENWIVG